MLGRVAPDGVGLGFVACMQWEGVVSCLVRASPLLTMWAVSQGRAVLAGTVRAHLQMAWWPERAGRHACMLDDANMPRLHALGGRRRLVLCLRARIARHTLVLTYMHDASVRV